MPVGNVLGEEGEGFRILMRFLDEGRLSVAASCVGTAERMLELAIDYAKERQTFGEPDRRPPGDPVDAGRLGGGDSRRAADDL